MAGEEAPSGSYVHRPSLLGWQVVPAQTVDTTLSATRRFLLTERLGLQFRAEIFNLFNHANFNTPNPVVYAAATGAPSPTAGVLTSSATSSRQVQFELKLLW